MLYYKYNLILVVEDIKEKNAFKDPYKLKNIESGSDLRDFNGQGKKVEEGPINDFRENGKKNEIKCIFLKTNKSLSFSWFGF